MCFIEFLTRPFLFEAFRTMSQTTVIDHISLEDLPPHVISYLSGYPPSERCRITKKLLAYAVSKLEVGEYLFRYTLHSELINLYLKLSLSKSLRNHKLRIDIINHPLGGVMKTIKKLKRIKSLQNFQLKTGVCIMFFYRLFFGFILNILT